jgi:hypothetical protein
MEEKNTVGCGGHTLVCIMFATRHYVCLSIPVCVLTGNPPSVFNYVVLVSEDFKWQSIESRSVK